MEQQLEGSNTADDGRVAYLGIRIFTKEPEYIDDFSRTLLEGHYVRQGETISQAFARAATAYCYGDYELAQRIYDYVYAGWFMFASPVLSNAAKGVWKTDESKDGSYYWHRSIFFPEEKIIGMPISCFAFDVPDTAQGQVETVQELATLSMSGGGVGAHNSIRATTKKAPGPIPYMKVLDSAIGYWKQGGTRRGAIAYYLDVDHPDILEHIRFRIPGGDAKRRSDNRQQFHNAVNLTEEFIEAVLDDKDIDLKCPHSGRVYETIKARELWQDMIETRALTGEPYMMKIDLANRKMPESQKAMGLKVKGSNLCVAPETLILTDRGHLQISKLVDQEVNVWNGKQFSKTTVRKTGVDQPLLTVQTANGKSLRCTPYHKFYVVKKSEERGEYVEEVRAVDLAAGDVLYEGNAVEGLSKEDLVACLDVISAAVHPTSSPSWNKRAPVEYSTLWDNNELCVYRLKREESRYLQMILQMVGVKSFASSTSDSGRDGEYSIRILPEGVVALRKLGLLLPKNTQAVGQESETDQAQGSSFAARNGSDCVKQVLDLGERDDTYCFTEPLRHMGVFNGILAGNCSEITLPTDEFRSFVCCLSSLNLEKFDEWKDTRIVQDLVRMLDNVLQFFIDNAPDGLHKAKFSAERERALGLGTFGWHALLQSRMIPFESGGFGSATQLTHQVYGMIKSRAVEESRVLAKERGEAPDMVGTGLRNSRLMAIAPNASSADLAGTSPSIEPWYRNVFVKDTRAGSFIVKNRYLSKLLESKGKNTPEVWADINAHDGSVQHLDFLSDEEKAVFKTAIEMDQHWLVELADQRGGYICQAQSLNLYFPAGASREYVNSVHLKFLRSENVVTLYYYRTEREAKVDNAKAIERQALQDWKGDECVACQG